MGCCHSMAWCILCQSAPWIQTWQPQITEAGHANLTTIPPGWPMGGIFKDSNLREQCVLRPSGWYMWLNLVKASIETFKILTGRCGVLLIFWPPKVNFTSKFPCLSHLPPTSLEGSASFFSLSLYGANLWTSSQPSLGLSWWWDHRTIAPPDSGVCLALPRLPIA